MSDQRITQLPALAAASAAATDVLPVADVSASQTKKITVKDLVDAGLDLVDAGSIDLDKLDQSSATKLGATALASGAVTAAKLAADSSIAVDTSAPVSDNFEGRGYYDTSTGQLQVYAAGAYASVTASIADDSVTTAKILDGAVTTAKVTDLGTAALADGAVTYAKIQDVTATDKLLGRSTAGSGDVEEITCTAAGRALLDDADAAAQRATLGLGTLATQSGTFSGTHSGTSSGTNTGDQTITLTGDITGSGAGSFTATIASAAVTEAKVASNAVSTTKIVDTAVTAAKLSDNSAIIVSNATPSGSGAFIGQQWLNTATGLEYTWTGSAWQRQAAINTITVSDATPLAYTVSYPDNFSANIDVTLDTQAANRIFAGPTTGVDAAPTFRALEPADLPDATASTKGVIQPGTGLSVTSGVLDHTNTATAGSYAKVTIDAQGHVTAGTTLDAADIPVLDSSKITTGTFGTALLADDAVTAAKLADYATAQIGEALPTADFIGQIFFNPLDKSFYLWDGNVWQPIGVSLGELVFAGTYDASTNLVVTTTTVGAAVGLVAGEALPVASSTLTSYYVVVAEAGTGTAPAPAVALAPPDIVLCDGANWTEIDVSSTYIAQTASNVGFTAGGTIAATNVQAAVEEVATEAANASNLTSGTVAVGRGGTGVTSYTKGDLLAASASTTLNKLGVGTNGQVLRANSATATGLEWGADFVGTVTSVSGSGAISVATGTTTPAISVAAASTSVVGVVQLSDSTSTTSSVLAATSTAVKSAYDLANAALPKAGGTVTGNINLDTNVSLVFEGTTADAFETTLGVTDPTADRTITLPDASGTVVTTGDTGTVTSTMIANGTIVDADINASAEIAVSKLADGAARQLLQTDAAGTGVEWTSNVDVPGTLDVTGATTLDSTLTVPLGSAASPTLRFSGDANSGLYSPGADQVAVATNGTGQLFINSLGAVGIGQSSPTSIAPGYSTLSVGTTNGGGIRFYEGATLRAQFVGNANGGTLESVGSTYLGFNTDGTERLRVTADGKLGLGTSTVEDLLHAKTGSSPGGIRIEGSGSQNYLTVLNTSTGGHQWSLISSGASNPHSVTAGYFYLRDSTAGEQRIVVDTSGRVGIGTTSPRGRLEVSDGTSNTAGEAINEAYIVGASTGSSEGILTIQSNDAMISDKGGSIAFGGRAVTGSSAGANWAFINGYKENGVSSNYGGYLSFATRPNAGAISERARIDSSGRLLIGTSSSPSAGQGANSRLVVQGYVGDAADLGIMSIQRGEAAASISSGEGLGRIAFNDNAGNSFAYVEAYADAAAGTNDFPGRLVFSTTADGASSPTERMRITQAGLTKISDNGGSGASRYTNTINHVIHSSQNDQWALAVQHTGSTLPWGITVEYVSASPNGASNAFFTATDSTTPRAVIRSNGGFANFQANDINLSDINSKKDISPAAGTWNCIKEWEIVNYRYKDQPDDADLNLGVIAQQVAESCPEVIAVFQEAKEATEDQPAQEERLGVKEQQMYWMAIKALQEAQVRIEQLEAKVAALEAQ